jgi:hypothetical protein
MEDDIRAFGIDLGQKAIKRDWPGVHEMLAPWLRSKLTPDDIRIFFEDSYRQMLKENGIADMYYPEYPDPKSAAMISRTPPNSASRSHSWAVKYVPSHPN